MRRLLFTNARLLDPASETDLLGELLVVGKQIADLGRKVFDSPPPDVTVIDCQSLCLAPGLVDMRAQLGEPGLAHKENYHTALKAAASGGVTSIVAMPDTDPVLDHSAAMEFVLRHARQLQSAKVFPAAAITRGLQGKELTNMGLLAEAGALVFSDGFQSVGDTGLMHRALAYASGFDLLIMHHAEDPSLREHGVMNEGEVATRLGLAGIPPMAEAIILERDMRLVAATGARYHAAHISTKEGVEIIRRAKKQGLAVTADTAPPYFSLTDIDVGEYRTFCKLSPPLRAEADRQAVIEGLVDGTIDAIASDHYPQDQDEKRLPFGMAAFGGVGLETLLPVSLELYHRGQMSLLDVLSTLSTEPAQILRLPAGQLAKGHAADFMVFDPDMPWKIEIERLHSKSKNSPFDHRPVMGRVMHTYVDGRLVYSYHG
ncbi:MAG: dihydroorotase [Alphaproteobacteria bacterium]